MDIFYELFGKTLYGIDGHDSCFALKQPQNFRRVGRKRRQGSNIQRIFGFGYCLGQACSFQAREAGVYIVTVDRSELNPAV